MSTRTELPVARTAAGVPRAVVVRWVVIGVAAVAIVAAALVERSVSGTQSGDVREAAAKLEGLKSEFGDWTSTEVPMNELVLRRAEAAGHVSRSYTNRKKSISVTVLVLCGPTGPIGAHEPKYCYTDSGFDMDGNPEKKAVAVPDGSTATYWSVRFDKKSAPNEMPLRVCWMWGLDGEWRAATDPRTEYALSRALFKIYVSRGEPRGPNGKPLVQGDATLDPIHEFLTDFLPEVNRALATPNGPTK